MFNAHDPLNSINQKSNKHDMTYIIFLLIVGGQDYKTCLERCIFHKLIIQF